MIRYDMLMPFIWALGFAALFAIALYFTPAPRECLRSEKHIVHEDDYYYYLPMNVPGFGIPLGKNSMLVWQPPRDYMKTTCLEYKEAKK